jgi:sulfonate transport system ATP-binding protein
MATNARELTSPPVVRVRDLKRSFGPRGILDGVDLDISKGEFVALLGRSGSGKSTLLRALAGLDHDVPGSGELAVPEKLSVVFQDARLLPWRRVIDNVILGLKARDARDLGLRALDEVELLARADAWPYQLSGGEQQRVALARSLVRDPELLLADEPFGALDALTRLRMHVLLRQLSARHQPAVLLVTHDVDEAIELANRIIVLDKGKIVSDLSVELPEDDRRAAYFLDIRTKLLELLGVVASKKGATYESTAA